MRARSAMVTLVGSVVVLALGIGLWRMTRSEPLAAPAPGGPVQPVPDEPAPTPVASPPAAAGEPAARTRPIAALPKVEPRGPAPPGGAPAPSLGEAEPTDAHTPMRDDNGKWIPIATLHVLREVNFATSAALGDCITRYGRGMTGKAMLTFIVSPNRGKPEVEATGVDEDETTISSPELLECMHRTATALKFTPVPNSVAVSARRRISIDNGQLAENWVIDFNRLP